MKAITIRLPKDLLDRLRKAARLRGIPIAQLVRDQLEIALASDGGRPWMRFAGAIKGGPHNLSSRKGFSRT